MEIRELLGLLLVIGLQELDLRSHGAVRALQSEEIRRRLGKLGFQFVPQHLLSLKVCNSIAEIFAERISLSCLFANSRRDLGEGFVPLHGDLVDFF